VAEVLEPFRAGQKGSSAMPHKRNPIKAEQMSGLARVLRGYLGAGLEDVALWHERDISHSSVERVILPDASILAHYLLVRGRAVIDGLTVNADRMLENLDRSFGLVFSQPVLLALVSAGAPRDAAYRIVQRNAMDAWEQGKPFRSLLEADPEVTLTDAQLDEAFSLHRALRNTGRIFDALEDIAP
jgi:adenylosuccinate lyase